MNLSSAPKLGKLYSQILKYTNTILASLPLVQSIDQKYSNGVNGQFTLMILMIIIILNVFVIDTCFLGLFIAFFYPAIRTIRTIKSTALVEYHRWATYWLIFISISFSFKGVFELIVGYLPYFELWKMGFFIALYHPKSDLAYKSYLLVLKPFLKRMKKIQKQSSKNTGSKKQQKQSWNSSDIQSHQIQINHPRKDSDASVRSS